MVKIKVKGNLQSSVQWLKIYGDKIVRSWKISNRIKYKVSASIVFREMRSQKCFFISIYFLRALLLISLLERALFSGLNITNKIQISKLVLNQKLNECESFFHVASYSTYLCCLLKRVLHCPFRHVAQISSHFIKERTPAGHGESPSIINKAKIHLIYHQWGSIPVLYQWNSHIKNAKDQKGKFINPVIII